MRSVVRRFLNKRVLVGLTGIAILALATLIRATNPDVLTAVREFTFDAYQRLEPREYVPQPVRIVDIDEVSIQALGQWPWPRTKLADLTNTLADFGAAVIAYDIVFSEPDRTSPANISDSLRGTMGDQLADALAELPDHDVAFADTLKNAPVVLGFALLPEKSEVRPPLKAGFAFGGQDPAEFLAAFQSALTNLPDLDRAASGIGGLSLARSDTGGIVRRVPLVFSDGTQLYPSLASEALRVAQGASGLLVRSTEASGEVSGHTHAVTDIKIGAFPVPTTRRGELWVHFSHDRPDRYISAADVLDPALHTNIAPLVDGHIVFVGSSATGLQDIRATPLGEAVPGVSIHAQAIEQILSGNFITRPDWADGAEVLATLTAGILMILALPVFGGIGTALLGAAVAAILVGGSVFAFYRYGLLIDPIYPSLASFFVFAASTALVYFFTEREKRFVRQAFGQYLSPHLVAQLERSPEQLSLGGEMRDMTILFMDIRGFTPISEQLTPTELVSFLNTLLSPLSDAIQEEDGTIDKYIGDSIMAFWNAPLTIERHAEHACRAGLRMLEVVDALNKHDAFGFQRRKMKTQKVQIGIGLNSGGACVGNMGSDKRFNYSVIGDAVNVASRIESSCKAVGADLLVSEDTRIAAPDFAYLEAGEIALKGKSRPVKLFVLAGDETHANSPVFVELQNHHSKLVAAIEDADLIEAATHLASCRSSAPKKLAAFYSRFEERLNALRSEAQNAVTRA
ncbi:adenylate/guanylate cyclase [Roseibium hamelinense]|uniref:Adenylate/guanylate cyclase n=1 Tax=Roseibium hamelinense TaxID=150831 RepID=A0A562SM23_9HYPH|nr:adenylate/guanylate cyclase domain-containing protein [Roseibium hamelinense]MTI44947.1 adenylate/guanylate cyclase domain-containing protein [Roseibium hamelinense]TWI82208.1 adenylate/guanylate cyclase [Roseibium hamelinense]